MIVRRIVLSTQTKNKLSRLKGKTGIKNWNVLCRWALCFSLAENTIPVDNEDSSEGSLEISWHTMFGENHEIYEALVKAKCIDDGLSTDKETLARYLKLHVARGVAYLSGTNVIASISDLLEIGINKSKEEEI